MASEPKELVDGSVYELYKPAETKLVVVFFHGLQVQTDFKDAWRKTWESDEQTESGGTEKALWPRKWLPETFPSARVLSVCYDSGATSSGKGETSDHLALVGDQLLQHLRWAGVGHDSTPVFLIGHSLGGLVIKQICVRANVLASLGRPLSEYAESFLRNLKGVFFYATPQAGADLGDRAGSTLGRLVAAIGGVGVDGDAYKYLKVLSPLTAELNDQFSALRKKEPYKWTTAAVAEKNETVLLSVKGVTIFSGMVVEEAAVKFDLDYPLTVAFGTDHFSVCRPVKRTAPTYKALTGFLEQELAKVQPQITSVHQEHAKEQPPVMSVDPELVRAKRVQKFETPVGTARNSS